jgi:hypothetical protein
MDARINEDFARLSNVHPDHRDLVSEKRQGATKMASPRQVRGAAQGFESQLLAARETRRRLTKSIAVRASSRVGRTFTSTKAIVSPRLATRSISPSLME